MWSDPNELTFAKGDSTYKPHGSVEYKAHYEQTFGFDEIGNMDKKISSSTVTPKKSIGTDLNYAFEKYDYYAGYAHRLEHAGNRFYSYDGNGNLIAERDGGHPVTTGDSAQVYNDGDLYYTDYGFGLDFEDKKTADTAYQRTYEWNERNLLKASKDQSYAVSYRYGADGQRALKFSSASETMYFNSMWMVRTDPSNALRQSKNIYVGESRIATKSNYKNDNNLGYEANNTYWYHSDHLGSAQLVTDADGKEHERIEYTPYGELWVEKTNNGVEKLPFRFTGKEFDEETGLYYYGARYLDPRVSRWLSTDPALGEYIPGAPVNEEARKNNENLPGMGGVFNIVNLHLYHYAGNNPVKYIDPTGLSLSDSELKALEIMKNKGAKEEDVARQRDQYLSTKENIVLYDPESFSSQAELEKKKIEKETDIETSTIPVKTEQEFKDAWERANNSDSVTLFFHSGGGESEGRVMSIDSSNNEYVTESATGQTPKGASATFIGDLPRSNIDTLNLMVCNGGNIDDDNNLARAFKFHHNIDKVRAWDGNVSFWPGTSNGRISIKGSKEFKEKYGRSPKGEITY